MSWDKPYIIGRPQKTGQVTIVHSCATVKDANYWLSYIALPGDAVFLTPAHPKHAGGEMPIYQAHLLTRGKTERDESKWLKVQFEEGVRPAFVEQDAASKN